MRTLFDLVWFWKNHLFGKTILLLKKKLPQFTVLMAQRLSNFPKVPEPVDDKSPDERTEMGASV